MQTNASKLRPLSAAIATGCLLLLNGYAPPAHAVIEDCDNGVNFSNGSTTKGLSATVRCVERETRKPYRTVGLRNGQEHGPVIWYNLDTGKPEREEHYSDGKRDGLWRRFDRDGRLTEENTWLNDRELGQFKRYDKDGHVIVLGWAGADQAQSVRLEYDATGQLIDLKCGDAPRLDVDRLPCGFAGRSTVRFAAKRGGATRTMQYLNGKLDGTVREGDDTVATNERDYVAGELREERVSVAGALRLVFRKGPGAEDSERFVHYDDGRAKAHTIARTGRVTGYESWWQNGQPKIQATLGERDTAQVRSFHDDGKPHETYAARLRRLDRSLEAYFETTGDYRSLARDGKALMTGRYERNRFVGEVNDYDEAGLLRRRSQVDADGARRRIEFDERGQQVSDQSFFADGSRKP